jgi:hypothetical protein
MARFHLTVLPDGRAVLTTPDKLDEAEAKRLGDILEEWSTGRRAAIAIPDCEVTVVRKP